MYVERTKETAGRKVSKTFPVLFPIGHPLTGKNDMRYRGVYEMKRIPQDHPPGGFSSVYRFAVRNHYR